MLLVSLAAALLAPSAGAAGDPLLAQAWSLTQARVTSAWALTRGSPATIVAVVDTGVDPRHPDLAGALVPGWNAIDGSSDTDDDNGHGTMVAGVVAARFGDGLGAAGVCPRCRVMPVKAIGADGEGGAPTIARGVVWAVDHGARVVNMSFAMPGSSPELAAAVAYARSRGAVVVAGGGNDASADPRYPAALPGVVGVAAVDPAGAPYPWSAHGGWLQLAAPGCSVGTERGGDYGAFCGTSAAAALVSGVAALAISAAPGVAGADVERLLAARAAATKADVADGRVDALAVVRSLVPERTVGPPKRAHRVAARPRRPAVG